MICGSTLWGLVILAGLALPLSAQTRPVRDGGQTGPLLIVGGGSQPDSLVRHFIDLAGGPGGAHRGAADGERLAARVRQDKAAQFEEMGADAFNLNATAKPRTIRRS